MSDVQPNRRADPSVDRAAATWYARRDAGLTTAETAEFERWLSADPRHAAVWREFDESFEILDQARESHRADTLLIELRRRQRQRRWRLLTGGAMGLAAAAALAIMVFHPLATAPAKSAAPAATVVVNQPEKRTLPDGSIVELNAGAAIEVNFAPARRGIRLVRGEAHFSVTKDPTRPFVVAAHGVEVQAVGTAFSVGADDDAVNVVVTEGRVAVARTIHGTAPNAAATAPVFADAGHRISIPVAAAPEVTAVKPDEIERELAWRGPRLEFSGTPLTDAVAAFNRENRVQLRIDGRELGTLRLSGVFRADNAEGFARMLERNYGARTDRNGNVITLRGTP